MIKRLNLTFYLVIILQIIASLRAGYLTIEDFEVYSISQSEFYPCFQLPDSQSSTFLFSQMLPNYQKKVQRMTIYLYSAFYGYKTQDYTILSMQQSNLKISLDYNLEQQQAYLKINGYEEFITYSEININQWMAITLDIQLQANSIQAQFFIKTIGASQDIVSKPLYLSFIDGFKLSELEINYGNPPKRFNVNPSCQIISYFSIGVSDQMTNYQINELVGYLIIVRTKLELNYDFFYTQSNPGQLISDKGDLFLKQRLFNEQSSNTISVSNQNFISTNYYDIQSQIAFSFYIKFNQKLSSNNPYLRLYFGDNIYDLIFGDNLIQLGTTQITQNIDIYVWNHITIINQYQLILFVNGIEQLPQSLTNSFFSFKYTFFTVDSSFQLNYIRLYSGSLSQKVDNCYIKTNDGSCIICIQNFLLDFQNSMQCVPKNATNTDNEIQGVKDWNPQRKICARNMINDNSSSTGCSCLLGYYFDGNQCVKCPDYCRYCKSLQECNQKRDSLGNCLNPITFDNGQDCIFPLFIIPKRTNIRRILDQPEFGSTCAQQGPLQSNFILTEDQLSLKSGDTIFFSFSLVAQTINQILSDFIIAFVKVNNQQIMKITLTTMSVNSSLILVVNFFIQDSIQKIYSFDSNELAWIAFWTDSQNFIFMFRANQYSYYDIQTGSLQFSISSNTEICVGKCDNYQINGCLSLGNDPITFIKNIPYPTQKGIKSFFTIYDHDIPIIGIYKLDLNQINFINLIENTSDSVQLPLTFTNPLLKYNLFQGFQLNKQILGKIVYNTNNYRDLFTISFNIEFDQSFQYQSFKLIKIKNSSAFLEVYLIPDYDQQIMAVQVFYVYKAKIFRKAVLLLNQSNFFMIIGRLESKKQRQTSMTTYHLEILCNYIKETMEIVVFPGNQIQEIEFGDSASEYQVFLDNINIFKQNVFIYFDYTNTDPCFIYLNLENMKCLFLKKGYLSYNNQIISYKYCSTIASKLNMVSYINQKDQTCNVKAPQNLTEQLCELMQNQSNQFICIKCKDQNADHNLNCLVCKKKYFFDRKTSTCQKCDTQCEACIDNSYNCIECKHTNQIIPSCNCIQSEQQPQNTCKCDYKCQSCSGIYTNFCIACSSNKRILPNCDCDEKYEEINNECIEKKNEVKCDLKCKQCKFQSENCTSCSLNRISPPSCYCEYGYEESLDGNCSPCQKGMLFDATSKTCKSCDYFTKFEQNQNFQLLCYKDLNVTLSSFIQNKNQYLKFTFDQNLKNFNLSENSLGSIVKFYISEVSNSSYSIINPKFIKNEFQVQLKVKATFQADNIIAILLTNKYFVSENEQYILSQKQLNVQLKTEIGPFLFEDEILDNQTLDNVSSQLNEFKSSNQNIFDVINQFQVVFYVLNTLQPVSIFLLLDATYPPQLYQFYQIVGTFVFPQAPQYMNKTSHKQFSIFGYQLGEKDSQQPSFGNFKRLGFCQSILVNIPILLIKQFLMIFLIILIIFTEHFLIQKNQMIRIKTFLIQRLNGDQETTQAITFICIFIQILEMNQESYLFRIGFYISIILILIQIKMFMFNIQNMKSKNQQKRNYSRLYTDRIERETNWFSLYYFQIQAIKKYFYLAVVCIFYKYPYGVCSICGTIFLISAILTIYVKAYKFKISRLIKFTGEIIFSAAWFMNISIIYLEQKFKEQKVIDSNLLQKYILNGNVLLWLLITYNFLFLIQFILDIILTIRRLIIGAKKDNSDKKNIKQNIFYNQLTTQNNKHKN